MKYNPDHHSCVVRNIRDQFKRRYPPLEIAIDELDPEIIWNTHQANAGAESGRQQDAWTLDDLYDLLMNK